MRLFKRAEDSDNEELPSDVEELRDSVLGASMPPEVEKVALKEIEKLAKASPSSAEYTIGTNHIDYLISLPWNRTTADNLDIKRAEAILEEEHYGLRRIKDRILEHLAVRILKLSRKHRILVVDDEEVILRVARRILQPLGYEVALASSGAEAIDYYLRHREEVDLVIIDLAMPDMDGRECFLALKKIDPDVRAILCTGYGRNGKAQQAIDEGMVGFIRKPYRARDLLSAVAAAIHRVLLIRSPFPSYIRRPTLTSAPVLLALNSSVKTLSNEPVGTGMGELRTMTTPLLSLSSSLKAFVPLLESMDVLAVPVSVIVQPSGSLVASNSSKSAFSMERPRNGEYR